WLLKMNPAGDTLWTKTYGGAGDDQAKDIIATSDGNYVITGRSNGAGGPNYDALLMKINPTGGIIWSHTYGGSQYEISHSVKQCADGGFVFTGQTLSSGMGLGDVYLVKTNSLGVVLWSKTYGGTNIDEGNALVENSDGSIVICAETSSFGAGNIDVYAIKTDSVGTVIWSQTYGGNDKDISHDIQHTSDGNYVIAAISRSFGWINPDMWIVKIADATGDTLWTKHYGNWYHDHCYTVKQTTDGGFIAIGHQEDASSLLHIQFVKLNPAGDIGPLSVNELASDIETSIYPNPTDGIVNIDWDATSETGSTFKINNALGQIIYSETIDSYSHSNHKVIDLRDRKPGVYFVTIQTAKNLNTKKLILR
ncbi:MAG: T9SS type A sorting domain-containing protein, partial [Bacteroidia bacterium]